MSILEEIKGTKITFVIDDKKKSIDVGELFDIDENNLTKEFAHQASLYAYFGNLAAEAEREIGIAAIDKDQEMAILDANLRKKHEVRDEKYTETMIRNEILTNEKYLALMDDEGEAKYDFKVIKSIVSALEMRAQMLISIGSHIRHEMDMEGMNIKDRAFQKSVGDVKETLRSKK
jgi:hypothetical protein